MAVVGYIVAGGRSSRFGSDKARALLADRPLLLHIAAPLRTATDEVLVVADIAEKYADFGLVTIADRHPGLGPLAGLETALADRLARHGPGWVLLASCDLVSLQEKWLDTLLKSLPSAGGEMTGAVAFRDVKWQPFPGAYHSSLLPLVTESLAGERFSFQALLSDFRAGARALPLPADWPDVPQVNTPWDLQQLRARSRGRTGDPTDGMS